MLGLHAWILFQSSVAYVAYGDIDDDIVIEVHDNSEVNDIPKETEG